MQVTTSDYITMVILGVVLPLGAVYLQNVRRRHARRPTQSARGSLVDPRTALVLGIRAPHVRS